MYYILTNMKSSSLFDPTGTIDKDCKYEHQERFLDEIEAIRAAKYVFKNELALKADLKIKVYQFKEEAFKCIWESL